MPLRKEFSFSPSRYDGNILTSERTEYLPPIESLCLINSIPFFFEKKFKGLLFFPEIIIVLFFFKNLELNKLEIDNVSNVFPDFDIKINKIFFCDNFFLSY